ncbi:HutD family protein [Brucellaceae bacterium C25G]
MLQPVLKAEDHRQMPWKNGGGVTVEIAIHPKGASVDNFDWRISTATVAEDGAFSIFPEIDRTLAVLEGNGIVLSVDGNKSILKQDSLPYGFAADASTTACLIDGAITDLNVMTRRGVYHHEVERIEINNQSVKLNHDGQSFLFLAKGTATLVFGTQSQSLYERDCAVFSGQRSDQFELNGQGIVYLITFKHV